MQNEFDAFDGRRAGRPVANIAFDEREIARTGIGKQPLDFFEIAAVASRKIIEAHDALAGPQQRSRPGSNR